ncbi:MAG: CDP-alcohol phosphatidyltransferase family protein [Thiohalospira sp.]
MTLAWLPNAISVFRIALVPPAVVAMLAGAFGTALILVLVAALSDGMDGWLARRQGWGSTLGAVLDPLADKLLMLATYFTLGALGAIPAWLAVLVIGRDALIAAGAGWLWWRRGAYRVAARRISKLNTIMQAGYLLLVLAALVPLPVPAEVVAGGTLLVVTTTLASGLDYLYVFYRMAVTGNVSKEDGT